MALQVDKITRAFVLNKDGKNISLADPNAEMKPEEIMKFYSSNYPELTNAIVEGPKIVSGTATYTFTIKAGKLG